MKINRLLSCTIICAAILVGVLSIGSLTYADRPSGGLEIQAGPALPLSFVHNQGQFADPVLFRADAGGTIVWLTDQGVFYHLIQHLGEAESIPHQHADAGVDSIGQLIFKMGLIESSVPTKIEGQRARSHTTNYFEGGMASEWTLGVPSFGEVRYEGVYSGIDLIYKGTHGHLEYDFEIAPGADPTQIRLKYYGVDSISTGPDGSLIISTSFGDLIELPPISYQLDGDSHLPREGGYIVYPDNSYGFYVGSDYDSSLPLVIDPILTFGTFFGGSGSDRARSVAIGPDSGIVVTGSVTSIDFPLESAYDSTFQDSGTAFCDVFVTKLSPRGDTLRFSTYVGGTDANDYALGIDIDDLGDVYICGYTDAADFPTTGTFQSDLGGGKDAFLFKLAATGDVLLYGSYLGGTEDDAGTSIVVDAAGRAFVTGNTGSSDFPIAGTPFDSELGGLQDAFVCRINASGDALEFSTFLGGSDEDFGTGVALDLSAYPYISGFTASSDFPILNGQDSTLGGGSAYGDAFITKLDSSGSALTYSTYLGASADDFADGISVDSSGCAYVAGYTFSVAFPLVNPFVVGLGGVYSGFISKLNTTGDTLRYSSFLGGNGEDIATAISVDHTGAASVAGITNSWDFPTKDAVQSARAGGYDAFVAMVAPSGDSLIYSTYLGGLYFDFAYGVATDANRNVVVAGYTDSPDFPIENPFQDSLVGGYDIFIAKLSLDGYDCYDSDQDGFGDPGHPENDCPDDNCPDIANPDQADMDTDGVGDVCDNCADVPNEFQEDYDLDGIGDSCDTCTDSDGDSYGDPGFVYNTCPEDNCPTVPNPDQTDSDIDGIGDDCDECTDTDGDGYGDPGFPATTCPEDNCPATANPLQEDTDSDGLGDSCDNCYSVSNPDQDDYDADGIGDSCDTCTDYDDDGFGNPGFPANTCDEDNCPYLYNPGQEDADSNGVGDACEDCCMDPMRGNIDFDPSDEISIADLVYLVNFFFNGGPPPPCPEEANVDGDAEGNMDIADLVHLVQYMFSGGPSPADCP